MNCVAQLAHFLTLAAVMRSSLCSERKEEKNYNIHRLYLTKVLQQKYMYFRHAKAKTQTACIHNIEKNKNNTMKR